MTLRIPAIILSLALHLMPSLAQAAPNDARDLAAIQAVVDQFRLCIIQKDKPRFLGLFHSANPEEVPWQFVVDDARLAKVQKRKPEARKARRVPGNTYLAFIDEITAPGAAPCTEDFRNVRIDTDGEVASVAFDYTFLEKDEVINRGREMWHLVRTEAGWRIISVIYSVRDPQP